VSRHIQRSAPPEPLRPLARAEQIARQPVLEPFERAGPQPEEPIGPAVGRLQPDFLVHCPEKPRAAQLELRDSPNPRLGVPAARFEQVEPALAQARK
jgi:hypothetical protein